MHIGPDNLALTHSITLNVIM